MQAEVDLAGWLATELGLDARALVADDLSSIRARFTGQSEAQMVERLLSDRAARSAVVDDAVVPETWFFRDPEMLRFVCARALEAGSVRVLSVPCASGEEPLGLAITLLDAGLPPSSITIDAVDVSPRAIARARAGIFGESSFRGVDPMLRLNHFEATASGSKIAGNVAELVQFHEGNVLSLGDFPEGAYDFVLCRNLFIYLHAAARVKATAELRLRVAEGGLLVLGPAEVPPASAGLVRAPGAPPFVWRASTAPTSAPAVTAPRRRPEAVAETARDTAVVPSLEMARALADSGDFVGARRELASVERRTGPSASMYFLRALLDVASAPDDAERSLRKALYLDPSHEEALFHLARLLERRGASESTQVHARLQRVRARASRAG